MSSPHPQPVQATQQADDAQYYRQVLHDLIDMGTDLARLAHQQATVQPRPKSPANDRVPTPDPATAFDRIARCIRRTVALARKLADPAPQAPGPAERRAAARKRIIRDVEDSIHRTGGPQAESLQAELADRLDAPDLEDDIATRPVPEIIAEICRDLGLAALPGTTPWKRRTPSDIEALCARAAHPARPRAAAPTPPASGHSAAAPPPAHRPGPTTRPADARPHGPAAAITPWPHPPAPVRRE